VLGHLVQVEVEELIAQKNWSELRHVLDGLADPDVAELLTDLPIDDEGPIFRLLSRDRAGAVFSYLPVEQQAELIASLSSGATRRRWLPRASCSTTPRTRPGTG
jgi:Mg/Co/Ni transporter MgtE